MAAPEQAPRQGDEPTWTKPAAVLFDRDGTLLVDVPYNGDPSKVVLMPGARDAVDRLREAGVPLVVVSNQSGIGRELLTADQVDSVNRRAEELLGPFAGWLFCPHDAGTGCRCRKPQPGLIERAAEMLGIDPADCVVVGDIGADIEAAANAGARAILVPNERTRGEEIVTAPHVARSLAHAVDLLLGADR